MLTKDIKPLLIGFEGPDGAGKTTQTLLLAKELGAARMSFPNYRSEVGAKILTMLKGASPYVDEHATALLLQSYMLVNRMEEVPKMLMALQHTEVILDRYVASGMAYGAADGLDYEWLIQVHDYLPKPDIYFLLDIPIEESFKRRPERDHAYEADRGRLERVRETYLELWNKPPEWTSWAGRKTRWVKIWAPLPEQDVTRMILAEIGFALSQV